MKPISSRVVKIKKVFEARHPLVGFLAAGTFLNVLMNFRYPAAGHDWRQLFLISPEIFILLVLLCLGASRRISFQRAVFIPLAVAVIFLRLFRVADNLVPLYFFRPFNLYLDSQFFPDLIFLLYSTLPLRTFILWCFLTVCAVVLIAWGIWRALKTIYGFFDGRRHRRLFLFTAVVIGGLLFSYNPWVADQRRAIFAPGIFQRVAAEIDFMLHLSHTTERHLAALDQGRQKGAQFQKPLAGLNGSDVYVFFVESYGHTVFADPRHAPLITPYLRDAERRLHNGGYLIGSNFLRSPAFGGSSWLAHGELASGIPITSQLRYDLLLTSQVQPIAAYFNRAGYRTVSVMPGTLWPWSAGDFYQYRKEYYAFDFNYRGPRFGWAPMPDQYVIDHIYRTEIRSRRQPLFIEFILVSSHAPFNQQPRYVPDWSAIGDGSIYHALKPVEFPVIWPRLENASEAYVTSVVYDFKVLVEFLIHMIDDDALIIILGDHQPSLKITGDGQPWSVPVHIISRNPDFIKPFIHRGYTPGLVPSQPLPHPDIASLLWMLLEDFS
jgi:Sulfatase